MARNNEMSASQVDAKLKEFETKLKRLYRLYEQYFIGVENRPPRHQRRQVQRLYRELDQQPMMKTSLKFRFRNLVQRFNSYKSYWNRVEREIEQGTYHRDVARAKARQRRREEREKEQAEQEQAEQEAAEQADDGAFELDDADLEDLDLGSFEEELQQMDERGEFEKYVATAKIKHEGFPEDKERRESKQAANDAAPEQRADEEQPEADARDSGSSSPPEADSNVKKKRLAELQEKLGLSQRGKPRSGSDGDASDGGGSQHNAFGAEEPTRVARPENPDAPSRGADMSKLRKLRRAKERLEREKKERADKARQENRTTRQQGQSGASSSRDRRDSGSNRVIRRDSSNRRKGSRRRTSSSGGSSDLSEEKSRKIYNNLVEAKRRCNEDTSNLNYDSFKKSMQRQRSRIQRKKGARDVDFKVVIKDGQAFLKPETKK